MESKPCIKQMGTLNLDKYQLISIKSSTLLIANIIYESQKKLFGFMEN